MPQKEEIAFAAYAPLPKEFGEKDRQRLAVAVAVLSEGSMEYTRRAIFNMAEGRTVQARLLPDGVLIRFVVPKQNLTGGVALLEGLVRRPAIPPESLAPALRRLQRAEPDAWTASLFPRRNDLRKVTPDEARAVLARVFRPETTVASAVGGFAADAAAKRWAARTSDWMAAPSPRYPDISVAPAPKEGLAGLTVVELRGQPFSAADPALSARWLTMLALGVGKGSSLFRDVRGVEGWSYRQEALLVPDRAGLLPRIVAVALPADDEANRAEGLRTTLLKSIDTWSEADRSRALGASSLGLGPLLLGDITPGDGILDRASLEAYWYAKAGVRWDMDRLVTSMREVSLDDLKAEAKRMLTEAKASVLPGRVR